MQTSQVPQLIRNETFIAKGLILLILEQLDKLNDSPLIQSRIGQVEVN